LTENQKKVKVPYLVEEPINPHPHHIKIKKMQVVSVSLGPPSRGCGGHTRDMLHATLQRGYTPSASSTSTLNRKVTVCSRSSPCSSSYRPLQPLADAPHSVSSQPFLLQQVRWKRKGADQMGKPCWHVRGPDKVRGRHYYPFHKMIGRSANWQKYQERYVPPRAVETKMRLIPSCYPNYRAMRESKAWFWLLPKKLAAATNGHEVLEAFLRFRHKQPKRIHHYLHVMTRLIQVGGCDCADWRFKYIISRLHPLRNRIVNMPRLALMYAKLNARREVKELTRFLFAKIDWYSMQQLTFIVRAFAQVKLADPVILNAIVRRFMDSLEFFRDGESENGLMPDPGAILPMNVDGLLTPDGIDSGMLERVRQDPNPNHQAYTGVHNMRKYNRYHYSHGWSRRSRHAKEPIAEFERRQRWLATESAYADRRNNPRATAVEYQQSAAFADGGSDTRSVASSGDRGLKAKQHDIEMEEGPADGEGNLNRKENTSTTCTSLDGDDDVSFSSETPGTTHKTTGESAPRGRQKRRAPKRGGYQAGPKFDGQNFREMKSKSTSSTGEEDLQHDFSNQSSKRENTDVVNAAKDETGEHDYLRPPNLEELVCVLEGCAALDFKHFEFCGTVAEEYILSQVVLLDDDATVDPLLLLHGARIALAFAKLGYRNYSFFDALSLLVRRRLVQEIPLSIKLTPGILLDVLRASRALRIHDTELRNACLSHIDAYGYEYPAQELAYVSYALGHASEKTMQMLITEHDCLDLNAATAVASLAIQMKHSAAMGETTTSKPLPQAENNTVTGSAAKKTEDAHAPDEAVSEPGEDGQDVTSAFGSTRAVSRENRSTSSSHSNRKLELADALLGCVVRLLTGPHRRESRERYDIAKMMQAMTLALQDGSVREVGKNGGTSTCPCIVTSAKDRATLFHTFCRHVHRHMQFLESSDFIRILKAFNRFEYWDARVAVTIDYGR
ncbi:unnamed protein product, partial [Amoebophrya sp. A25]